MILGVKISNFKSFKDEIVLDMAAGRFKYNEGHLIDVNKKKYLKFTSIFGANGSGKSNLVSAIELLNDVLNLGSNYIIDDLFFRGNVIQKNIPTLFEIKINLNNKIYKYGFKIIFNEKKIIEEWLYETVTKDKVIYYRNALKGYNESIRMNRSIKNCLDEMNFNTSFTFLTEINRRLQMMQMNNIIDEKNRIIFDIYNFFKNDLIVIKPNIHKVFSIDVLERIKEKIKILNEFDINIKSLEIIDDNLNNIKNLLPNKVFIDIMENINSSKDINKKFSLRIGNNVYILCLNEFNEIEVKTFKFKHENCDEYFGTYEESDGTLRVFELLDIIFANNKVFIIDEMDNSLHPLLLKGLLKKYFESKNNNQLIITTHDTHIMDYDFIRRDEIWFTSKNIDGSSMLYSLEKIKRKARTDLKFEKAYLDNKFGAVSIIK